MARRAAGFDMKVVASDPYVPEGRFGELQMTGVPLDVLLEKSDYVSVNCPLTAETRHLINAPRLSLMKPSAVLVNSSRGPVVDEAALAAALKDGTIFAAGLDVFEEEPKIHPDLAAADNAFLLPHWGSTTDEDRHGMTNEAVANVIAALTGEPIPTAAW